MLHSLLFVAVLISYIIIYNNTLRRFSMKFFVAIAISIVKYCSTEPIIRRSLEDCTFADIFLTKVKGCDIKELYERRKLYNIEEKIIPYVKKRNEDLQQRMAATLPEFPPECDQKDSICKIDETRLCICPKTYVCDPVSGTRIHQCVLLGYYAMSGR